MDDQLPLFRTRSEVGHTRLRAQRGLVRVRHGVYAPRHEWAQLAPWERYRARVLAHAAVSPNAVFCHESAAALLGLPVFDEPKDVHVFDAARTQGKRLGDLVVHASADPREVVAVDGVLMTSPAHTAVDLGRVLPPAYGLSVWDGALRLGCTPEDLTRIWTTQVSSRGRNSLRWLDRHADGASESPLESVSRAVAEWLGFPPPELQVVLPFDGHDDRVDMFWRAERIAGEADGHAKYWIGGDPRGSLRAEKAREDRLRRHLRAVARWDFAQVLQVNPFRDVLRTAGLREVRPPDHAMLATLHPGIRLRRSK